MVRMCVQTARMNPIFTAILVGIGAIGSNALIGRRMRSVDKYCKGNIGQFAYAPDCHKGPSINDVRKELGCFGLLPHIMQ